MTASRRARRRADKFFGAPDAVASRERELSQRIRRATGEVASPRFPADGLAWPLCGRITSRFGDRLGRFHTGIDIAAAEGTPVVAAAPGRVLLAEMHPEYGNVVVVDHGDGFTTLYGHHRELLVSAGDRVGRDAPIGRAGATGHATGPHLHFETRMGGAPCDPVPLLPPDGDAAEALRLETIATLRRALAGIEEVVLVGSTLHANAGDSLIWLGQIALLSELGIRVRTIVHPASFDRRPFDDAPPGVAVLLSGGGNFGDLWPLVQRHREWLLGEITNRRIVQLPQSFHFVREESVAPIQRLLARRDDVLLMWRDRRSLRAACDRFEETESQLAPDVAFARRPPRVVAHPVHDVVWIARDDQEGGALRASLNQTAQATDWSLDGRLPMLTREALWFAARVERRVPLARGSRARLVLYNRSALMTVAAAARLVASARVVVTDRLHAHVLCTMLAVPHVVLDDGYGKTRAFLETWPVTMSRAELASSPADANARAARMLQCEQVAERR